MKIVLFIFIGLAAFQIALAAEPKAEPEGEPKNDVISELTDDYENEIGETDEDTALEPEGTIDHGIYLIKHC